eukprot:s47_g53.t1
MTVTCSCGDGSSVCPLPFFLHHAHVRRMKLMNVVDIVAVGWLFVVITVYKLADAWSTLQVVLMRTLMRGEAVIFARRVLDSTARKKQVDGQTKRVSLKMAHWVAVIRAALDQQRIGELVMDGKDGRGPRLVLHMPSPDSEGDIVVFHNRLMSLCGVTFSALAERMAATTARTSSRAESAKVKAETQEVPSVAGGADGDGDGVVAEPKAKRRRSVLAEPKAKKRRLRPLRDAVPEDLHEVDAEGLFSAKGEDGCDLVKDEVLKQRLLELWRDLLVQAGYKDEGLTEVAKGQPFKLRMMEALLDRAGDPDHKFLLQGERGYPVGVLCPLPRTPHMYEEQTSWKLEDDPYMKDEIWRDNYESVAEHEDFVREHFAAECQEGLMEKLTMEQAKQRYGDKIAVSSLAVLVEESHGNKRRIIHDATHGTKINNRIRCRDKQRSPGAREKRNKDEHIFVNLVGTFGVASASYWWGRIAGAGIRLTHELLGPEMPVEMLIFADDLESLGAGIQGRRGVVLAFLYLSTLGFPFKCSKQRGGLKVEWIGLYADYTTMKLGLSPSRAAWMERWTRKLAQSGRVTAKEMEQGLGRLGFAANALTWERPFLGPLYSWTAAVRTKHGLLRIPAMLRTILWFLANRIQEGGSLQQPAPLKRDCIYEITFFTDAKATAEGAWIGGFIQSNQGEILEWYSEEVKESWAPWLFIKKDPKRVIAALELLATLVAVRLWAKELNPGGRGCCWIRGGTDNLSNSYAVSKWMSTKYPLTILIMELSETLRVRNCELCLEWIPREKNQLADDLTNQKFDSFPGDRRVGCVGGDTQWLILDQLMHKANEFHEELAKERRRKASDPNPKRDVKKRRIDPWDERCSVFTPETCVMQ